MPNLFFNKWASTKTWSCRRKVALEKWKSCCIVIAKTDPTTTVYFITNSLVGELPSSLESSWIFLFIIISIENFIVQINFRIIYFFYLNSYWTNFKISNFLNLKDPFFSSFPFSFFFYKCYFRGYSIVIKPCILSADRDKFTSILHNSLSSP